MLKVIENENISKELIAAAPEMLEALEFLIESVSSGDKYTFGALLLSVSPDYIEECQEIIRKAKGDLCLRY